MKRAAKARLENASLMLAKELLGMATDENLPPAVKLAAIKDALDRAGLSATQAVALTHDMGPRYERLFDHIHWEALGRSEAPEVVDGEIVGTAQFDDGREP
ncbi:hypothetical protein [Pseudonocardia cypriaca]|uniref:hypothetical protein n=1 Tax=Pseudonocardia cypriaca TaxID=882449 RepID=UPI0011544694|nr:hypothetical protein [Pseudonocardia cypriaca]